MTRVLESDLVRKRTLLNCASDARAVDAGEIAQQCADKNLIAERVRQARVAAVEHAIQS